MASPEGSGVGDESLQSRLDVIAAVIGFRSSICFDLDCWVKIKEAALWEKIPLAATTEKLQQLLVQEAR